VRTFVAANFDAALREQLFAAAAPLRDAAPSVAWVKSHLLHMTLKFLGEQSVDFVAQLTASLESLLIEHPPGSVRLQGYGAFPNFRDARVVWMGGNDSDTGNKQPLALAGLAKAVDDACASLGIAREERPFRAHVTLGRVRKRLSRSESRRLEEIAAQRHEAFPWHVGSVDIMRSDLGPAGPTYTVLHSVPLVATP
jgi:2'-5' RNA ligase